MTNSTTADLRNLFPRHAKPAPIGSRDWWEYAPNANLMHPRRAAA